MASEIEVREFPPKDGIPTASSNDPTAAVQTLRDAVLKEVERSVQVPVKKTLGQLSQSGVKRTQEELP